MSQALVKTQPQAVALPWNQEQLKLITDTVAKGATPDELKLFLYRCQIMELDPLKPGQIHFVKYGNSPGTIVVGIEGFRARAARTGKLSGIKRGVIRDEKGKCVGAWAEIYRTDWTHPAREEVSLHEYNTGKAGWAKMPETMIKKVAEAAALRMAFPDDLGGIYESSEMDQAKDQPPQITVDQPDAGDGNQDNGYRIPFGKYKGRMIEEIDTQALRDYHGYLTGKAAKEGKQITGVVAEFLDHVEAYLGSLENQPLYAEPGAAG